MPIGASKHKPASFGKLKSKSFNTHYSQEILLKNILVKDQPRKAFKNIEPLAKSIQENGLLEPIITMENPDNTETVILIAGERRYRAFLSLNKLKIPAIIIPFSDNKNDILVKQLIENIQREDLNIIEKADSIKELKDHGLTYTDIENKLGIKERSIRRYYRISKLANELKLKILESNISLRNIDAFLKANNEDGVLPQNKTPFTFYNNSKKYIKINKSLLDKPIISQGEARLIIKDLEDTTKRLKEMYFKAATRGGL